MNARRLVTILSVLTGLVQLSEPLGTPAVAAGGQGAATTSTSPVVSSISNAGTTVNIRADGTVDVQQPADPAAAQRQYQVDNELRVLDWGTKLTEEQKPKIRKAIEAKLDALAAVAKDPAEEIAKLPPDPEPRKANRPNRGLMRATLYVTAREDAKIMALLTPEQHEELVAYQILSRSDGARSIPQTPEQKTQIHDLALAQARELIKVLDDPEDAPKEWIKATDALNAKVKKTLQPQQREELLAEAFLNSVANECQGVHATVSQRGQVHLMAAAAAKKMAAETDVTVLTGNFVWVPGAGEDHPVRKALQDFLTDVRTKVYTDAQREEQARRDAELKKAGAVPWP